MGTKGKKKMQEKEENNEGMTVDSNHKLLGKYVISLTKPVPLDKAVEMAEHLNSMPSNYDHKMFIVKHTSETKSNEKKYIVLRKLCLGDNIDFIDYPDKC